MRAVWVDRLGAFFLGLLTLVAGTEFTRAQEMLTAPVRIGVVLPAPPEAGDELAAAVARSAEQGAVIAEEEFAFNAEMLGIEMTILRETASGPTEAVAAAERMVAEEGAFAIIGGYDYPTAVALGQWAATRNIPFVNVGTARDALRNELCAATTFHVEPSAAMYLDAIAGWYIRAGFRRWFVIYSDDEEGGALYDRLVWSLNARHFGAGEAGRAAMMPGSGATADLINDIRQSGADLVLLLVSTDDQLHLLYDMESAGLSLEVAGFPYADAQTRTFFATSRETAPVLGTLHRATSWEATLDAYGAREMNSRYRLRWNEPMDSAAWSTYQAIKILYEAAFFSGSTAPEMVMGYMTAPQSVFDVYKGIGTSFRSWDRQLRQSLYLDKISETETDPFNLALLVGELPAIYMPGTNPVERLDQLGDLAAQSRCAR